MKKFWAAVWVGFALSVAKFVDLWNVVAHDHVSGRPEHRLHRWARRASTRAPRDIRTAAACRAPIAPS